MFSDPLILAIVSMLCGLLLGFLASVLGLFIYTEIHADDDPFPTDEDMDQMCLWYEAEYGQKGAHEK